MTIRDLLHHPKFDHGMSMYQLRTWFGGCQLRGDVLLVPDQETLEANERMFGDKLRTVLPALKMMLLPPALKPARHPVLKANAPQLKQGYMLK